MNRLRIYVDVALTPEARAVLEEGTSGHELMFPARPVGSVLSQGEPEPQLAFADVAFGQPDLSSLRLSRPLRWIQVSSSGITRYDTAEFRALAKERGWAVSNSATVYHEACAAHVLSFLLAQARMLPLALRSRVPNGSDAWQSLRERSRTLRGDRVLILGYGAIGRRLAQLLEPMGAEVVAYRRQARGEEGVPVVTGTELPRALGEADHVVNILPESEETRGFFDAGRFAAMKPGAVFYNIGRGATVDQEALLAALRSQRLEAAWLDVTTPEPLPDEHPLWAEPRCFITPHTAGGHPSETTALVRHFLQNLGRYQRHEPLLDRVM